MKKYFNILLLTLLTATALLSCSKFPLDENDMLITSRPDCYMTNFDILGSDHRTVLASKAVIDTTLQTVNAIVVYGTNLKNLKPFCSLATDASLTPSMGVWTDFSDLSTPKEYTVISGNKKNRKTYKIYVSVQQ